MHIINPLGSETLVCKNCGCEVMVMDQLFKVILHGEIRASMQPIGIRYKCVKCNEVCFEPKIPQATAQNAPAAENKPASIEHKTQFPT